jgi:hypothetical protein
MKAIFKAIGTFLAGLVVAGSLICLIAWGLDSWSNYCGVDNVRFMVPICIFLALAGITLTYFYQKWN